MSKRQQSGADSEAVAQALFRFAIGVLSIIGLVGFFISPMGREAQDDFIRPFERHESSGTGLIDKLRNDYGLRPTSFLTDKTSTAGSQHIPVAASFAPRRTAQPLVYSRDQDRDDFIIVFGSFDFEGQLHGALLLDRKGRVLHRWVLPVRGKGKEVRADYRIFPHGFILTPEGAMTMVFDSGKTMLKVDACSNELWRLEGHFHHAMEFDPNEAGVGWTLNARGFEKFNLADGDQLSIFDANMIEEANPELDIFGIRQIDRYDHSEFAPDAMHFNDIDPLPTDLAEMFPMFAPGDLLISARSPNLIFVVDPETAQVKWHASGYWRRQHDPDWGADGRIYVYNNNMHRGFSSIVAIDPASFETETVIDGARYDFYSAIRGKQKLSGDGRRFITSPQQGRAFELDENGEISFEFINLYDAKTGEALVVSEAYAIARDGLSLDALKACAAE